MDNNNVNADELGYTGGDTVNLKAVFGKIRKKTEELAEASKKIAGDVGEVIKNSVKETKPVEVKADPDNSDHIVISSEQPRAQKSTAEATEEMSLDVDGDTQFCAEMKSTAKCETEEISLDLDEIKSQVTQAVKNAMSNGNGELAKLSESMESAVEVLENVKLRLQAIQRSSEDGLRENTDAVASMRKSVNELRERVTEISQAMSGVSRISDSVFDLKNAQVNMKKSIDSAETSIKLLKKKLNVSVAVLSILSVLIIALQIIAVLS